MIRYLISFIYAFLIVQLTGTFDLANAAASATKCQDVIPGTTLKYSDSLTFFSIYNGKTYAISKSAGGDTSAASVFFAFNAGITHEYSYGGPDTNSLKMKLASGLYGAARPVSVSDNGVLAFIKKRFGRYLGSWDSAKNTYIDAWKEYNSPAFTTIAGNPLAFTNWSEGQAPSYTPIPQALVMGGDGLYRPVTSGTRTSQIVEFDGEMDCATAFLDSTQIEPPPPSQPVIPAGMMCGQDLNLDNFIDQNEMANCVKTPQGNFCPIGALNCNATYQPPVCPEGSSLNPQRDMCQADPTVTCPSGYTWDKGADKCLSDPICTGGTYNPATNRCETIVQNVCPEGYVFDSDIQVCQKSITCPNGGVFFAPRDRCETAVIWNCPSGYNYNLSVDKCEASPYCPSGWVYNTTSDRCEQPPGACPTGYSYNAVLDRCTVSVTCPDGGTLNVASDKCELMASTTCNAGWTYNAGSGKCEQNPTCAAPGGYDTTYNLCMTASTGTSCPAGYLYSNSNAACTAVPTCVGGTYNAATDRCEAIPIYSCTDPGYSYNPGTAKCEASPYCPSGWVYNTTSDRCEQPPGACPTGYSYSTVLDRCIVSVTCPDWGGLNGVSDKCELMASTTCNAGWTYSAGSGKCEQNPTCATPGSYDTTYNLCMTASTGTSCPVGYLYNSNRAACTAAPTCIGGTYNAATDRCEVASTKSCPDSSYTYNVSRSRCEKAPVCPIGMTYSSTLNFCVQAVIQKCALGYTYNSSRGRCEYKPPTCVSGTTYNAVTNRCESAIRYAKDVCYDITFNKPVYQWSNTTLGDTPGTIVGYAPSSSFTGGKSIFSWSNGQLGWWGTAGTEYSYLPTVSFPGAKPAAYWTNGKMSIAASPGPVGYISDTQKTINVCYSSPSPNVPCTNVGQVDFDKLVYVWSNLKTADWGTSVYGYAASVLPSGSAMLPIRRQTDGVLVKNTTSAIYGYGPPSKFGGSAGLLLGGDSIYYAGGSFIAPSNLFISSVPMTAQLLNCAGSEIVYTGTVESMCPIDAPGYADGTCYANPTCAGGNFDGTNDVCWTAFTPTCTLGSYDSASSYCVAAPSCINGTFDGIADTCFQANTSGCPSGYTLSGTVCVATPSCTSPGTFSGGSVDLCLATATFSCPSGYSYSASTGQCYQAANCNGGGLNPASDKCESAFTYTCPSSYSAVGSICQLTPSCTTGGSYSSALKLCDAGTNSCSTGVLDAVNDVCYQAAGCANGTLNVSSDKCEETATPAVECPSGYSVSGGICVLTPSCTSPGTFSGGSVDLCLTAATFSCPSGYSYSASTGQCYQTANCNGGGLNPASDKCESAFTYTCPSSYSAVGSICQLTPSCTTGGSYSSALKLCDAGTNSCSTGVLDAVNDVCYQAVGCANGTLNVSSDKCEETATPDCGASSFDATNAVCFTSISCDPGAFQPDRNRCEATVTKNCGSYVWNATDQICTLVPTCGQDASYLLSSTIKFDGTLDMCASDTVHNCVQGTTYIGHPVLECEAVPICTGDTIYDISTHSCFVGDNTCPLGNQYVCMVNNGVSKCSANICEDAASGETGAETDLDENMYQDDGQRDADGNCLGQIYIFNGKPSRCRPPGMTVGWINDCCESDTLVAEDTGSNVQNAASTLETLYDVGTVAYNAALYAEGGASAIEAGTNAIEAGGAVAEGILAAMDAIEAGASLVTALSEGIMTYATCLFTNPATLIIGVVVMVVMKVLMGSGCDATDIQTGAGDNAKQCHHIGDYCQKQWFGACVQRAKGFCCFNSKMARIIHEQGRPQLTSFQPDGGWGTPSSPNCRGFTPEEFSALNFSTIDLSEYFDDVTKDLGDKVQGAKDKVEGAIQNRFQQMSE